MTFTSLYEKRLMVVESMLSNQFRLLTTLDAWSPPLMGNLRILDARYQVLFTPEAGNQAELSIGLNVETFKYTPSYKYVTVLSTICTSCRASYFRAYVTAPRSFTEQVLDCSSLCCQGL